MTKIQNSKVSVHIVTWNSRRFIENALRSLEEQTFRDFSVLIVDNGSTDGTVRWVKENYPQIKIVQNNRNLGFAKAHNQAIHFTKSDYVLVMNPDIILTPHYIGRLIMIMEIKVAKKFLDREKVQLGSAVGKIYRLTGDPENLDEKSFTRIIDTTGLKAYKSRRFVERGAGEINIWRHAELVSSSNETLRRAQGDKGKVEEIFGVSGSLAFYRREALEDAKIGCEPSTILLKHQIPSSGQYNSETDTKFYKSEKKVLGEYFDEDFHSYKEDIDLAWRLQLRGWQSIYLPEAVAYHHRVAAIKDKLWDKGLALSIVFNRSKKPSYVHIPSYRNHLWLLVKNEQNFWRHSLYILWYELRKLVYILLFEQKTLKGLWEFFKLLPKMKKKRKIIQSRAKVSAKEIRFWFNN